MNVSSVCGPGLLTRAFEDLKKKNSLLIECERKRKIKMDNCQSDRLAFDVYIRSADGAVQNKQMGLTKK